VLRVKVKTEGWTGKKRIKGAFRQENVQGIDENLIDGKRIWVIGLLGRISLGLYQLL
jgi:hypothetical protein